ncbi:Peptidyl-prolyl cis-trans isomerase FKBP16-1, chloroplastic [Zostera marina]|uniref:peptidylprolyl isomerase n=1 Tax=Zostera marina TaxID=29655 RepID=A0A0K9P7H5_ZOSMR|nr:Peptidyl-prolyl cis-trans isomerase FKBP16-1, chloroplastic [Zostera marina]
MEIRLLTTSIPPINKFRACHKEVPRVFTSRPFHRLSRRQLFSEFAGGVVLSTLPAFSAPLIEGEEPHRYEQLENGVKYEDVIDGEGTRAEEGNVVEINYVCRRSNGYFIHSTIDQFSGENTPALLLIDDKEIIKGLKDVLIGMKVGGKRRALIPPNVGYINEKLKPIPDEFGPRRSLLSHAKEPLVFEVQLLKIL